MSARVPSREQCLRASAHLKFNRGVYRYALRSPLVKGKRPTCGCASREEAGALLIAADGSIRDANAALLRASDILEDYIDLPGVPPFAEVVRDLALRMLRCGWRRRDSEVARECAELAAPSARLVWWSEESL